MTHGEEPCGPLPTRGEEIANAVSHGLGLLGSLVAAPYLLGSALRRGDRWSIAGTAIFVGAMVVLYGASTVYHALPRSPLKQTCRLLDHAAVFLLIAGTYTPFTLGVLRGPWGWALLAVVWSLAVAGVVLKAVVGVRHPRLSTAFYLVMGWLAVVAIGPFRAALPAEGLLWLLAGGIAYTGGVGFFLAERVRYSHFAWHLCVLAGTACHAVAVGRYAL